MANPIANLFIEESLQGLRSALETTVDADVLAWIGPMRQPVDEAFRDAIEARGTKRGKLAVLLETSGGSVEVVRRCVDVMRHHYPNYVEFIVPNFAYSAGTVMCLSGNEIRMDYFSVLGPIDPQLNIGGRYVPAWGYVDHYNRLINKAKAGTITNAEVSMLISGFDYAQLHQIEQFRELSTRLLKEWLPKYKFSNWSVSASTGQPVTAKKKLARAQSIANKLNNTRMWNSHGTGISRDVMEKDVGVKIDDFGANLALSKAIKDYHALAVDYMQKMGYGGYLHSADLAVPLWRRT